MAEEIQKYQRKVSADEVQQGFILVLKDFLGFFPKPDVDFSVKVGDKEHEVHVEAYDCWCMGPRKPHMHYKISIRKFRSKFLLHRGSTVTFTKLADKKYELTK